MKDFEYLGSWWLPSNTEQTVNGTLKFSQESGFQLTLLGALKEQFNGDQVPAVQPIFSTPNDFPLIVGTTTEGKKISLSSCVQSRSHYNTGGGGIVEEYHASIAYIGIHLTNLEETRFHKAEVRFSRLSDWISRFGFDQTITHRQGEKREEFEKYELTYVLPEDLQALTPNGKLAVFFSFGWNERWPRAVHLRQSTGIRIEGNQDLTFADLQSQFISPLQNLISLATNRPTSVTEIVVYSRQNVLKLLDDDVVDIPIQVIFRTHFHEDEQEQRLFLHDMLFTLKDVEDDFHGVADRWLSAADELDSVYNLFCSVQYNEPMYLEHRFLSMVQAIEAYHRRRFTNQVLPIDQHMERVQSIIDQTPNEHKSWLKEVLNFSNEPRLAQRLRELVLQPS